MKILFISRAYPPIIGGIENQNFELSKWLSKIETLETLANRKGKKNLPFFLPYSMIIATLKMRKFDVLLLGDGVLGIVGWIIKKIYPRKTIICVVHGLDLTYKSKFYQKYWIGYFLKYIDGFIAVGNETVKIGIEKGIEESKIVFIPNGVDSDKHIGNYSKNELEEFLGEILDKKYILLTSGRLVKRKGVAWFIEFVMPNLPLNIIYVVAGDGPDKHNIEDAINKKNLQKRVKLLGYISDKHRDLLLNTCDIFIQPNIRVEGDVEGFGISVIEASSCGLPVIASNIEGLKDAIKDNQNGFLIESGDEKGYREKIMDLLQSETYRKDFGKKARQFCIENYHWDKISKVYIKEIKKVIQYIKSKND